jgi:dCTP deaminase
MILSGNKIIHEIQCGAIHITPFHIENVNPDSYDISIGDALNYYEDNAVLSDLKTDSVINRMIPGCGFVLKKNKFYFAESMETIISNHYVPILHNRSGVARKGMFVHITADLMQLYHNGKVMLQLFPEYDIRIYSYQKIAQISFWNVWY